MLEHVIWMLLVLVMLVMHPHSMLVYGLNERLLASAWCCQEGGNFPVCTREGAQSACYCFLVDEMCRQGWGCFGCW